MGSPRQVGSQVARMSDMTTIDGEVAPGFEPVREAVLANFAQHGDIGAALCVYQHGRPVVSNDRLRSALNLSSEGMPSPPELRTDLPRSMPWSATGMCWQD